MIYVGNIYIGTSGWQYRHWKGIFYPEDLATNKWLTFYSQYFNAVEINSSFYHQTKAATFTKWQQQASDNFIFAVKGHRFITHIKKLKDIGDSVNLFFNNVKTLIEKRDQQLRHVILWQLPPSLKIDINKLNNFIKLLPTTFRHVFEFRHKSWIDNEVRQVISNSKVECTVVLQDWHEWPQIRGVWGKFVYIRLHGRESLYSSNYSEEELKTWAEKIKTWQKQNLDVYAYFNNDAQGYAAENAKKLKELLGGNYR